MKNKIDKGIKSSLNGIFINLLLALVKLITGIKGSSFALVADAVESITDIFKSFILIFGVKIAIKPRDENHPYGHGKAEPLVSMIVAFSIVLAAFYLVYKSLIEIRNPHTTPAWYTLLVLGLVIIIKEALFRYIFKIGDELESQAIRTDAWHHRSDAITSGAAFIGITISLIGGNGFESADDWAALFAACIIAYNGFRLLKQSLNETMDIKPYTEIDKEVLKIALGVNGVQGVESIYIRKMGFDYFVDMHIIVNGNLTVKDGHNIAHKVKNEIMNKEKRITDIMIHIEPEESMYDKDGVFYKK